MNFWLYDRNTKRHWCSSTSMIYNRAYHFYWLQFSEKNAHTHTMWTIWFYIENFGINGMELLQFDTFRELPNRMPFGKNNMKQRKKKRKNINDIGFITIHIYTQKACAVDHSFILFAFIFDLTISHIFTIVLFVTSSRIISRFLHKFRYIYFFCICFSAIYRIRLFLHTPQRTMEHTMLTIYWTFHCCMKIEKRASHKNPNKTDCPMHCSFWPNVDRNRIRSIDTFCAVQILNGMI